MASCNLFQPFHFCNTGDDDQKGALKLLFQLLCVQPKKGGGDMRYLFSQHEVSMLSSVCAEAHAQPTGRV